MNRRDAEGDSKNEVGHEHEEGANLSIPGQFSSVQLFS